ncbi:MAG: radical SAM protein [Lachnospiraceae bacterium]|nr:radical SAM protein [Lachnospiraceae bacterium]
MILLVKPESIDNGFSLDMALRTEPLELEYISAMLKAAHIPCYLYEAALDPHSFEDLLYEYHPEAVAITGYITQENRIKDYASRTKAFDPDILTLVGGSHAQKNAERFFEPDIDFICRSDNIFAILDILEQKPFENIDGLCYHTCEGWQKNPIEDFDINRLPIPDRSHMERYLSSYRYLDVHPVALLKTSSSCPHHCSFCYGRTLNNGRYYQRDLSLVIEELQSIASPNIQIVDDDFLYDTERLWDFISLVRSHNIHKTFICYGRADFITENPELMKALSHIGLRYVMIGLEAVSNRQLDSYAKGTSLDINCSCVRLLQELSIQPVGLFIVDIRFRRKDFKNLHRFIHSLGISYIGISIFTPIPGTALYRQYEKRLITRDPEKWDFMHLVVPPVHLSIFRFYLEYFLLVMDLFRLAQKKGIYKFLHLNDYKHIFRKLLFQEGLRKN